MRESILIAVLVLGLGAGLLGSPGVQGDEEGLEELIAVAEVIGFGGEDLFSVGGWVVNVQFISGVEGLPQVVAIREQIQPYLLERPKFRACKGEPLKYAWNLLVGRTVWVVHYGNVASYDIYGRTDQEILLTFIYLDSERTTLFQAIMISQGLAKLKPSDRWLEEEESFREQMERLEEEAKNAGRGLWGTCP